MDITLIILISVAVMDEDKKQKRPALDSLIEKGVFQRIGEKKSAYYELENVG